MSLFPIGRLTCTRTVDDECNLAPEKRKQLWLQVVRHATGDDGELGAEEHAANLISIAVVRTHPEAYGRVMSVYDWNGGKLWIITDFAGPDTYTTILRPRDY